LRLTYPARRRDHWATRDPSPPVRAPRDPRSLPSSQEVIEQSHTGKQSTFLVRTDQPILDPAWTVRPVTLDELVLAYIGPAHSPSPGRRSPLGVLNSCRIAINTERTRVLVGILVA